MYTGGETLSLGLMFIFDLIVIVVLVTLYYTIHAVLWYMEDGSGFIRNKACARGEGVTMMTSLLAPVNKNQIHDLELRRQWKENAGIEHDPNKDKIDSMPLHGLFLQKVPPTLVPASPST